MGVAVEEVRKRLEAVREIAAKSPSERRKAADEALGLFAELDNPPPELCAFAAKIDGTAWRAIGEFAAAERCYNRAKRIYREALTTGEDLSLGHRLALGQADLCRRWSFLCLEVRHWDRGMEMLDRAQDCFLAARDRHEVGRVHLARGHLLWERGQPGDQDRGLEILARAVELIDPGKSEGAFLAARHNLNCALTLHPEPAPESLGRAYEALQRSRLSPAARRPSGRRRGRQRFGHSRFSVPDAMRRWLQGKIWLRLCQHDDARPFLESAQRDLMALGNYPRDVFAVTLDLAECYLWALKRPWQRILDLLVRTFAVCPPRDVSPETEAALALFRSALEARNPITAQKHLDTARQRHLAAR